ncbi:MAG: response regulator [Pedobacter agri]
MNSQILNCILVDDQSFAIENLKEQIELHPSLKILAIFTDPRDALAYLQKSTGIDILFSDVDMPWLSGIELAAKTRHLYPHLVFVTAHPAMSFRPTGVGIYHHLHKPFSSLKFQEVLHAILKSASNFRPDKN